MESKLKYGICPLCGNKSRRTIRPLKIKGYFTTNVIGYRCLTCDHFEPDEASKQKSKQYSVDMLSYLTTLEQSGIDINSIVTSNKN